MRRTETYTLPISDNSLVTRFEAALANVPEWAKAFTATVISAHSARVTYYDSEKRGVDLRSARNYIERHR